MPSSAATNLFVHVPIRQLSPEALEKLSKDKKLSLSREDMVAVQGYFVEKDREPTDVELEVIAQTWSEHCKHRIFGSRIEHSLNGKPEIVDGLFKSYIRATAERIMERKPGFVLSAFVDNAGFIKLDETHAVCLKVETHNHPSAIEPYAGANTGLGGVIRDILGAGLGAKPIANLDVFCFGSPDTRPEQIKARDVIHPLGIMRGVVRGVRDYGNRMGIPTVNGAIQFDETYIYNPLVFCGTAGVIPSKDIAKEMRAGLQIVAVGGRTGRDGLKGATFSSASLTADSHEEDKSAVQIGNPIEEKKVLDFILEAREQGWIVFITDCGAGGFSSAAGEMLSETGGELFLERAPLKEPGLRSWEIFLSESQERMVFAATADNLPKLQRLADKYQTEMVVLGQSDGTGILKVWHDGQLVCDLDCQRLHEAPRQHRKSTWTSPAHPTGLPEPKVPDPMALTSSLRLLLQDFAIVSREPIIREYDHQVQGNTLLTPLAGAAGDAPQDGAVVRVDGSPHRVALACSLLPEWGKTAPYEMGAAVVDECVRQLVATGADPDQIAILDNFCMGNPDDTTELGALVESVKGMCDVAEIYGAPFVSGKDSFYNYFLTDDGPVSIPVTALVSGVGIVPESSHVIGSSLRRTQSVLCLIGTSQPQLGGSVYARIHNISAPAPATNAPAHFKSYRAYHHAVKAGLILSTHDIGEGGLAVAAAEMGFSLVAGIELELPADLSPEAHLFSESPGRLLIEISPQNLAATQALLPELRVLGKSTPDHKSLRISGGSRLLIDQPLAELKSLWKTPLAKYY